jgi:hypothetical protein
MDDSEVVMMIRAILASKKDPINLNELKSCCLISNYKSFLKIYFYLLGEYIEANGMDIPFRSLGFPNVIKFLESIPDKVNVKT